MSETRDVRELETLRPFYSKFTEKWNQSTHRLEYKFNNISSRTEHIYTSHTYAYAYTNTEQILRDIVTNKNYRNSFTHRNLREGEGMKRSSVTSFLVHQSSIPVHAHRHLYWSRVSQIWRKILISWRQRVLFVRRMAQQSCYKENSCRKQTRVTETILSIKSQ